MPIGYAGFQTPRDDDFDLTPLVERLEASPSWMTLWREEMGHKASTDAAYDTLSHVMQHSRKPVEAARDYVEAYERDDRANKKEAA